MKRALYLLPLAIGTSFVAQAAETNRSDSRPNIVLFMVDDMGWGDTSLPFWTARTNYNELFETPNMERLAQRGMMFTQAYASSISSPTRCSLFTGSNAARHRVTNWTLEKGGSNDGQSDLIIPPPWNLNGICQVPGIPSTYHATSLAQLLKDGGYHTIHCGKAHLGARNTPGENPYHFGFEVNIAGHAGGGPATYLAEENFGFRTDGKEGSRFAIPGLEKYWGKELFLTEVLTQEAIFALDKAQHYEQPFFLYMSHYAVHVPINKDKRFYQHYIDKGLSPKEAAYAALVKGMDKSLGDLMDYLDAKNLTDHTVFIFMSDNGGLAAEASCRDGEVHTQNYPLNSGKGSAYEGGIREPMLVSWPGKVQPQSRCDKYLIIEDFFPTLLEMAGIGAYKTVQQVDGKSFMPLLLQTGDPSEGRSLFWNCPNIWGPTGPGIGATCTIRKGDWKLVYYYETAKKELFHLNEDIGETHNRAADNPRLVKELSQELGNYLRNVGGQRPSFKHTGMPCPWPDEAANR